ncbi:MAG: glycosyltransferase family 4 protein [Alphaproteobacteria bacterium]|nr:glycosyltransferase family 4 protein [Alphaproteobacteria bacterium]
MRIAFYAPMKSPHHPVPSGDRRMARLLWQALAMAGHQPMLASQFRGFSATPECQAALRQQGALEAARLLAAYRLQPDPPAAWFTYHLHYKAPDWLGPAVTGGLNIPYLVAEASFAPKRAGGPWDLGHRAAEAALRSADAIFCLTRLDARCVAPLVQPPRRLLALPPFLDGPPAPLPPRGGARAALARRFGLPEAAVWLLAVAMLRTGDKLASYARLAAALGRLGGLDWRLLAVGGGPAEAAVRALFSADLAGRVTFLGQQAAPALAECYAAADIYVWPGVGEAYGMAYLEAQAAGLPVVAGAERGVPEVVLAEETGLLTAPGDDAAFADAIRRLATDNGLRRRLGARARDFALNERHSGRAAAILDDALRGLRR